MWVSSRRFLHTASLEDHGKHLSKGVDGLKSLINADKTMGAVEEFEDSKLEKVEKRFVDRKSHKVANACY